MNFILASVCCFFIQYMATIVDNYRGFGGETLMYSNVSDNVSVKLKFEYPPPLPPARPQAFDIFAAP